MPGDRSVQILLIEDNPAYIRLVRELLVEAGEMRFELEWAGLLSDGLDRIEEGGIDVVLLDLLLPDNMGTDTLRTVLDHAPDVPVVVLTGVEDEDLAHDAVEMGAQDYLSKGSLDGQMLARSIQDAVQTQPGQVSGTEGPSTLFTSVADRLAPALEQRLDRIDRYGAELRASLGTGNEPAESALDNILEETRRARAITGGLLDLAEVATNRRPFTGVDCEAALDRALLRVQGEMRGREATVTRHRLPTIHGDPQQISHLFEQLVRNAVHHAGDQRVHVEIDAERNDDAWVFEVRDDGPGLEGEVEDRAFDAFEHGARDEAGPGLGLAVCEAIVEQHGGRIWMDSSDPSPGCTVRFSLPDADRAADRGASSEPRATNPSKSTSEAPVDGSSTGNP